MPESSIYHASLGITLWGDLSDDKSVSSQHFSAWCQSHEIRNLQVKQRGLRAQQWPSDWHWRSFDVCKEFVLLFTGITHFHTGIGREKGPKGISALQRQWRANRVCKKLVRGVGRGWTLKCWQGFFFKGYLCASLLVVFYLLADTYFFLLFHPRTFK